MLSEEEQRFIMAIVVDRGFGPKGGETTSFSKYLDDMYLESEEGLKLSNEEFFSLLDSCLGNGQPFTVWHVDESRGLRVRQTIHPGEIRLDITIEEGMNNLIGFPKLWPLWPCILYWGYQKSPRD